MRGSSLIVYDYARTSGHRLVQIPPIREGTEPRRIGMARLHPDVYANSLFPSHYRRVSGTLSSAYQLHPILSVSAMSYPQRVSSILLQRVSSTLSSACQLCPFLSVSAAPILNVSAVSYFSVSAVPYPQRTSYALSSACQLHAILSVSAARCPQRVNDILSPACRLYSILSVSAARYPQRMSTTSYLQRVGCNLYSACQGGR